MMTETRFTRATHYFALLTLISILMSCHNTALEELDPSIVRQQIAESLETDIEK